MIPMIPNFCIIPPPDFSIIPTRDAGAERPRPGLGAGAAGTAAAAVVRVVHRGSRGIGRHAGAGGSAARDHGQASPLCSRGAAPPGPLSPPRRACRCVMRGFGPAGRWVLCPIEAPWPLHQGSLTGLRTWSVDARPVSWECQSLLRSERARIRGSLPEILPEKREALG